MCTAFYIPTSPWPSSNDCGWNIQHCVKRHWSMEELNLLWSETNFWIFHNIKVSTTLNYSLGKEHVVADHVLQGFNDWFNSSDSRDKNVCTLCHLETTHVWSNVLFTNQNIAEVWRDNRLQIICKFYKGKTINHTEINLKKI